MKRLITITALLGILFASFYSGINSEISYKVNPCFEIIKDTTDERGLTSIVITDGIDTFAYDYLKPQQLADLKANNFTHSLIKTDYVCPDCGEWGCIYEDIDTRYDEGTDIEIETAIYEVCKERGIKDAKTIDLIKANYYL